jgi:hypothetical protein
MATTDTTTTDSTTDDNAAIIRDAHDRILQAIADLKAIGVAVPIALHLAAHAIARHPINDRRKP